MDISGKTEFLCHDPEYTVTVRKLVDDVAVGDRFIAPEGAFIVNDWELVTDQGERTLRVWLTPERA